MINHLCTTEDASDDEEIYTQIDATHDTCSSWCNGFFNNQIPAQMQCLLYSNSLQVLACDVTERFLVHKHVFIRLGWSFEEVWLNDSQKKKKKKKKKKEIPLMTSIKFRSRSILVVLFFPIIFKNYDFYENVKHLGQSPNIWRYILLQRPHKLG